jgi:hypothetical protein
MKYRFLTLSLSVLTLVGFVVTARARDAGAPHLAKRGEATQLIADGKPYQTLGAEIHNSSSSSLEYMEPWNIWSRSGRDGSEHCADAGAADGEGDAVSLRVKYAHRS